MGKNISTIYCPSGRAAEYGEYALNIYDGCPHACKYCYAPNCLHKDRDAFHADCKPRPNIVEETAKRLAKGDIKGKHIFLCFACDPYPYTAMHDHSATNKIIDIIHDSGNYVQLLTKGCLPVTEMWHLNTKDIFGITVSCSEENERLVEIGTLPVSHRLNMLKAVKEYADCKTFISCEPVLEPDFIYEVIKTADYADEFKIGKLNYHKPSDFGFSDINWGDFGRECERLCKEHGRNYYIKESLRAEMNKDIVEKGKRL